MMLNSEEKKLIAKEIEELEQSSSAELIAVITQKSSNYKYASFNGFNIFCFFNIFYFIFPKRNIYIGIITISTIDFCRNKSTSKKI